MSKQREFGLDLARAAAVTLVLTVHFFANIGFYEFPLAGRTMMLATTVRMSCMVCVPLFMVLTGWLCIDRRWSPGYYRKLLPILLTYVLVGTICMLFRIYWLGEVYSPRLFVLMMLEYSTAPYAWYIEMYIGLFLLSPFLNAAWRGLGERERLALVVTLIAVTAVPALLNFHYKLVPDWWTNIYPLTYYFLGAWLREHPVRARGWVLALGWLGLAAAASGIAFIFRGGKPFAFAGWNNWGSLLVMGETVCLFPLLARCDGTGVPAPVRWCVGKLSQLSLPLYLLSYITDQLLYPHLTAAFPDIRGRLPWLPVIVLAGLAGSGVMAQAVDWAVKALMRLVPKMGE